MSQEKNLREAGRRLATDLKDLREDRQVDVEVLLKTIRLSPDILEKFDESALIDHPAFNRVYLRSIVTSYATVLGIDVDVARNSLEQALLGKYKNQLRKEYLSDTVSLVDAFVSVGEGHEAGEVADLSAEVEESADFDRPQAGRLKKLYRASQDYLHRVAPNPSIGERGSHEHRGNDKRWSAKNLTDKNLFSRVFLSVLVLAALGWVVSRFFSASPSAEPDNLAVSGLETDLPLLPDRANALRYEPVFLPDSMEFSVIALYAPVDPIRVTRDRWARRPYWIEFGDTLTFRAAETVSFESDIESALIKVKGFALPDSFVDSRGRIELPRERVQRWLDSLIVNKNRPR